jgi:hypothetical protein
MIKDCLIEVVNNKYLSDFKFIFNYLIENLDEHQLEYTLNNSVYLNKERTIILFFNAGIGFRCNNLNRNLVGRLPICNQLEKILNKKYIQLYNNLN